MISSSRVAIWNRALDRIGETDAIESEDEDRSAAAICRRHYDDILRELLEARPWAWAIRQRVISKIDSQSVTHPGAGLTSFAIPYAFLDTSQVAVVRVGSDGSRVELEAGADYAITLADAGVSAHITTTGPIDIGDSIEITVTTSRTGWEHVYALPADCVTPLALLEEGARHSLTPVAGRVPWAITANDAGDGQLLCCNHDAREFVLEYVAAIDYVPAMPRAFVDALVWRLAAELCLGLRKDPGLSGQCMAAFARALDIASAQDMNLGEDAGEAVTPGLAARG